MELATDKEWTDSFRSTPQVLRVNKLGDSGIDIKILGDVKPLEQWRVTGELRLRLKKAFDEVGIEIPWPHTKLYFGNSIPGNTAVICPLCNQPNQSGNRFCTQCGASLVQEEKDTTQKKKTQKVEEK